MNQKTAKRIRRIIKTQFAPSVDEADNKAKRQTYQAIKGSYKRTPRSERNETLNRLASWVEAQKQIKQLKS